MICVLPTVGAQDNWLVVMEYSEDEQRGAAKAGCEAAPDKPLYDLWRACAFILIFAGVSASGQQLVQNGGFETGNFTGWTQSGNLQGTSVSTNSLYVHSGNYGAQLGPTKSLGFLSQTVATSPGQSYLLSIWLENSDNRSGTQFEISWNGTTIFNTVNLPIIGYINLQFVVSATASSTVLQFGFEDDRSFLGLDDISVTAAPPNLSGPVAVYGAPATNTWNKDVTKKIINTGFFPRVDDYLVGAGSAVPTLAQLKQYSSVMVYSDAPFNDPVSLGNVLADYLDSGGGVVLAAFDFYNNNTNSLQGRISTGGYLPLTIGSFTHGTEGTLVADEPLHPILSGVSSFDGGTSSFHCSSLSLTTGATLVGQWSSDGQPLVATKQLTAGRVVALNFYPPSSDVRSDFWVSSTSGGRLMANALLWASSNEPPQIVQQPSSITVTLNQAFLYSSNVTFSVSATGTAPLSYQWRFDGANLTDTARISGTQSNTLSIAGVQMSDAGTYSVVVVNALGIVQSAAATLTVLTAPGSVYGWGYNYYGAISPPAGVGNFVAISARDESGMGLRANGTVVNWGLDHIFAPPAGNVAAIAAGGNSTYDFCLALQSNGTVVAWGDNTYGALNVPSGLSNVMAIAAGGLHGLALLSNRTVIAWGNNGGGQTNVPPGLANVVAIAAGGAHSLALKNDGTVVAWGYNGDGETNVPPGLSNVVAIAAGSSHNLALRNNGTVVAWGYSAYTNVPAGLSNVVAIAAADIHSLVIKSNGTIAGWGDNNFGEVNPPFGLSNVVAIAGGNSSSLVLTYTPPPVPVNDNFANATPIFGSSATMFGANINASWEPLENGTGNSGPASVWWKWTPDNDGPVTISTSGSSFSTQLAVYTGNSIPSLSPVQRAANTVNFFASGGTPYYIDVDGYNAGNGPAEGAITLSLNQCVAPAEITVSFDSQQTESDGVHLFFSANVGVGTPPFAYQWTVSSSDYITSNVFGNEIEVVLDRTGSNETVNLGVTVFNGCGSGPGSGGGSACGTCLSPGQPNLLTGTSGSGPGPGKTNNCGVLSSHTLWYATMAGATGPITVGSVGSSNVNQLAVYTGNSLGSLTYVGCTTNRPARVTFNGTNGMVYWFALDPGTNAASGLTYGYAPHIDNYGVGSGSFSLQSGVAPPIAYQLLATTNPALNLSNWSVVLTTNWNLNNSNYFNYRLNYVETNHLPQRFYLLQP